MNTTKRTGALVLAMLLSLCLILGGCGGQESGNVKTGANEANYQVAVADALGNPFTEGVIVRFMQNGQQVAMQVVDGNGVASKVMAKGEYNVELMFTDTDGSYYYDQEGMTLTADKHELSVVLAHSPAAEATSLVINDQQHNAYRVATGCTRVDLVEGQRNYFLFTPTVAGSYRFSVVEDAGEIGYYGAPHFVQTVSVAEVVENAFTISIKSSMIGDGSAGTTTMVIGVDATASSCTLAIERVGEAEHTVEDEPWTVYAPTVQLNAYKLPAGAKLEKFDLTASGYNLVLNEKDGFYHMDTADGPLVLVSLGKDVDYLACFKTILDRSGVNKYFYDEDGNFLKKETYDQCLLEYFEYMDEENGVYPLTEDLKYIIQQRGDYAGWFDKNGQNYLFMDENRNIVPGINDEITWLFMCFYIAG